LNPGEIVGRRGVILIGVGVLIVLGVASTAGVIALFPPERVEVTVASPAQSQVLRPGTWTFRVRNLGPVIGDFGLDLGGGGWLQQHAITTSSPSCRQDSQAGLLLCGAIADSGSETISITATPSAAGSYFYRASFCDCSAGRSTPLLGPNSPRFTMPGGPTDRYAESWTEQVLAEPTAAVAVSDINGNALSGATVTVQGSSVSATTAATGIARLGLGPLASGIYTVIATHAGYVNTGTQISVPDSGDPQPVSITMIWAPPTGRFVWQPKSTLWEVMDISGGNPDYLLGGFLIEWHCYGNNWSRSDVAVILGRDQLTFDGANVPMGPGTLSRSFVLNGPLPDTTQLAPAGTCINGQNAW
jgi:hypothetical protein